MLPGVLAQRVPRSAGDVAYGTQLDFVNGIYAVNNQLVDITTFFAADVSSAIIPGRGLDLVWPNWDAEWPEVANTAFANKLLSENFTIIIEILKDETVGTSTKDVLYMWDYAGGAGDGNDRVWLGIDNWGMNSFDERYVSTYYSEFREINNGFGLGWPDPPGYLDNAIHRIGLTFTNSKLVGCLDGDTPSVDPGVTMTTPFGCDTVWIGSGGWGDWPSDLIFRKIFVYDPVEDSVLQSLTEVA